jgi:hypothetical protein
MLVDLSPQAGRGKRCGDRLLHTYDSPTGYFGASGLGLMCTTM